MIKIKCATIKIIKTGKVFHSTISHSRIVANNEELQKLRDDDYEKGFFTSEDEFVNRYKALRIARRAGQTNNNGEHLYSYMIKLEG